jgi:hypothetical protein
MVWSFDERALLLLVVALVGSLTLLMSMARGQAAHGAPAPAQTPAATCPGDTWCPGPSWHVLFDTGLPPVVGGGGADPAPGSGRPMVP